MIEDKVSKKELERIRKDIASEGEEIDYKEVFKFTNRKDKLELIKDIVAIANTRGGYIVYGVKEEHNGKFEFIGLDSRSDIIKHENILDFMKNYVNFRVNIAVGVHEIKDETFYLIYVAKHVEDDLISFTKDGTYERENFKGNKQNKTVFKKYEMYGRKGCENTIINHDTQFKKIRNSTNEIITNIDSVEAPYDRYVEREDTLKDFLKVLDDNISCIQINGLGGIGKTSFIYNFCKKILNKEIKIKDFKPNYIIWITGKLTIFKPTGAIEKLKKFEINYDEFIDVYAVDEVITFISNGLCDKDSSAIVDMLFDLPDFGQMSSDGYELYEEIAAHLLAVYFDAYKNIEIRRKCEVTLLAIEDKISHICELEVRNNLCKMMFLTLGKIHMHDWNELHTEYSYKDKMFLNEIWSKYGWLHFKNLLYVINQMHITELLPEIILPLNESLRKCGENYADCKEMIKANAVIINKIITKAFLDFNDDIKCDHELVKAFEEVLETLVGFGMEEAAVILDEFRVH